MGGVGYTRPPKGHFIDAGSAARFRAALWRVPIRLIACLLACALTLCACQAAEPVPFEPENAVSDAPIFDYGDVEAVFADFGTLASYADSVKPQMYFWSTYSITGDVYVEMLGESETVIVRILQSDAAAIPLFKQEQQGETSVMPEEILALGCLPAGAVWIDTGTALKPPRGVGVGDSIVKLITTFRADGTGDGELYTIAALNPDADDSWRASDQYWLGAYLQIDEADYYDYYVVYSWARVDAPAERREYWHLYYTIMDGAVDSVTLSYDADLPYEYVTQDDVYDGDDPDGYEWDEDIDFMELPEPEEGHDHEDDDH